ALDDDLNTPEAIAGLHELRDIASQMEGEARVSAITRLRNAGRLMGFLNERPEDWRKGKNSVLELPTIQSTVEVNTPNIVNSKPTEIVPGLSEVAIDALILERASARKAKDFARSDQIRDDLAAKGIIIEDGPDGATWRRE
ncbi:MAG: hypothetical protein GXP04_08955, partial [Alphaproteobacteria bacterium]|nr:hypothetical protein [Alphaproteobacteria bacterium]